MWIVCNVNSLPRCSIWHVGPGAEVVRQEWRSSTLATSAGHISASPWRHSSERQPGCMVLSTSAAKLWEFSSCVYIAGHRPYKLVVTMATRPRLHPGAPFDPTDREPPRLLVNPPNIRKRTLTRKRKRHSANNKMRDS